jgi:hypothetical protein
MLRAALGFSRKRPAGAPVLSYIHPYDVDAALPREAFLDAHLNPLNRFILNACREKTLPRLARLLGAAERVVTYGDYALAALAGATGGIKARRSVP